MRTVQDRVIVGDARFVVNSGRLKVRETGQKNVHAYVRGVADLNEPVPGADVLSVREKWREVTYNPHVHDSFVYAKSGNPVHAARMVALTDGKAYVLP